MSLPQLAYVLLGSAVSAALIGMGPAPGTETPGLRHPTPVQTMAPAGPVRAERASDGLFYVNVRVGTRDMRFLVDTGASMTVISPGDAKALGLDVKSTTGPALRTVGGVVSGGLAEVPRMEIAGREIRHIEVAVVEHGAPAPLLGQNALAQLGQVVLDTNQVVIN
ncbi:retropepsin-like aspartic protease [Novosphingobium aerophilum]